MKYNDAGKFFRIEISPPQQSLVFCSSVNFSFTHFPLYALSWGPIDGGEDRHIQVGGCNITFETLGNLKQEAGTGIYIYDHFQDTANCLDLGEND